MRIGQGHAHGLLVADLADQDDVGRLAQGVLECDVEAFRIRADFALVYDRLLVLENELDRVLQRKDMAGLALVAIVDHRRQGGGLARAGCPHHQDQAALGHDHFL